MLVPRLKCLKILQNARALRLLSTQIQQQTDSGLVVYEKLSGTDKGIAIYGLNSPKERNALGFALIDAMKEVNQLLREETKISVVILHSLVPGIFCAGKISQTPTPTHTMLCFLTYLKSIVKLIFYRCKPKRTFSNDR